MGNVVDDVTVIGSFSVSQSAVCGLQSKVCGLQSANLAWEMPFSVGNVVDERDSNSFFLIAIPCTTPLS